MRPIFRLIVVVLFLTIGHVPISAAPVPGDLTWDEFFAIPGLSSSTSYENNGLYPYSDFGDEVAAIVTAPDGKVYMGGQFKLASGRPVRNVARWDGMTWSALGDGLPWPATSLALDSLGRLYAGGKAAPQDTEYVGSVARWDGTGWQTLGTFRSAPGHSEQYPDVNTLALDASDHLYVGGAFYSVNSIPVNGLARLDGSNWISVSGGVNDGMVNDLWSDSAGNLYAGGTFDRIGGVTVHGIAYWDRTQWNTLSYGVGRVNKLAVGGGGMVYTIGAAGTWSWNGVSWTNLNFPTFYHLPGALLLDNDGSLLVGGSITLDGTYPISAVERWQGGSWSLVGASHPQPGLGGSSMLKTMALSSNGDIYLGGVFSEFAALHARNIVRFDRIRWLALGPGQGSLPAYPDLKPAVMASGADNSLYFGMVKSYDLSVYQLKNGSLTQLGPTFYSTYTDDNLTGLAVDRVGNLYVGGSFATIGGVTVNNIARWDGTQWQPMQGGLDGRVRALALDPAGNLYVGGIFYHAGDMPVDGLAIWGPLGWEKPFGPGLACNENCGIHTLAWDPVHYQLYIGGVVATPAGWRQVLVWDPFSGYYGITGNPYSDVKAMVVDANGHLFVGFSNSYSASPGLAEWDGTSWSKPGNITQVVRSLTADSKGNVYVGGDFTQMNGQTVNYITHFDGSQWYPLGSGLSMAPTYLMVDGQGRLYASGYFDGAGSRKVNGVARWSELPAARLWLNYTTAQPGSQINVTGENFLPNSSAQLYLNGQMIAANLPTGADGSLRFGLTTAQAGLGRYTITVQQNPTASASFLLRSDLPLRQPELSLTTYNIPAGLGFNRFRFLPNVQR
jgi:hypothetical protein